MNPRLAFALSLSCSLFLSFALSLLSCRAQEMKVSSSSDRKYRTGDPTAEEVEKAEGLCSACLWKNCVRGSQCVNKICAVVQGKNSTGEQVASSLKPGGVVGKACGEAGGVENNKDNKTKGDGGEEGRKFDASDFP